MTLAKAVFEIAVADERWKIIDRHRLRGPAVRLLPAPKATCALTSKLARIATAVWMHQSAFDANHPPPLAA